MIFLIAPVAYLHTVVAKGPAKIELTCPHCGNKQREPARVQSTYCQKCGQHFKAGEQKQVVQLQPPPPEKPRGFLERAQDLLGKKGPRQVRCFECGTEQEVVAAAKSTICPSCSAFIDLTDFQISSAFNRNIRTRGTIHVTAKGDLGSTRSDCADAIIEGKLRGDLIATGKVKLACRQKLFGTIEAGLLLVERKSETECGRPMRCEHLEVNGKLSANVTVKGSVLIRKHGALHGDLQASSIQIEKGGVYEGQLTITPPEEPEEEAVIQPVPAPTPPAPERPPQSMPLLGLDPLLAH